MQITFRSDDLPKTLSEAEQLAVWREFTTKFFTSSVYKPLAGHPFDAEFKTSILGGIHIGRFRGTMESFCRTAPDIEAAPRDDFMIGANIGATPLYNKQAGREETLHTGDAIFATVGEPGDLYAKEPSSWMMLGIPRTLVHPGCPAAENLVGRKLNSTNPGLRHLTNMLELILDQPPDIADLRLRQHIETTLVNLVIVAIETERDLSAMSDVTSTRAERLRLVFDVMQDRFRRPNFSIQDVVRKTKLSERYVRNLLSETGTTFSKRLLEIRLRRAHEDLRSPSCEHMKVGDIALACGFEDISNFNRRFREQFDLTPSELRRSLHSKTPPKT